MDFDTDDVWTDLAETGRHKTLIDFCQLYEFREQLHAEAREEGVQLRINVENMPTSRPTLYIYLRKMV